MELEGDGSIEMTEKEIDEALREMLHLRQDVGAEFSKLKKTCPYLK